nr:K-box region and MADS-box transcription factor family protein [Tanacetum cinerariifolium]
MGRRKLEMKRIEDKNSRQVTFSKRRTGLMKKARHLSVLCDVDIAVLVFSANGKLYKSCSGTSSNRYERSIAEVGERTNNGAGAQLEVLSECTKFRTCKELLQTVDRLVKENNSEELSVTDMTELEQELDAALVQTRLRKYLMQLWNSYKMLDSGGMLHISPGRKMWILESWGYICFKRVARSMTTQMVHYALGMVDKT